MPAPLLTPLAGAALSGLGRFVGSVAAGLAADYILGNDAVEIDNDGVPVSSTTIQEQTSPVTVDNRPVVNQTNRVEITITDDGTGQPVGRYAVRPNDQITDQHRAATREGLNNLARTEHGRSALSQMAEAAEAPATRGQRSQALSVAEPQIQRAMRQTRPVDPLIRRMTTEQERRLARGAKSDRSRTSLEYHEWKHNCLDPGMNYDVLQHTVLTGLNLDLTWAVTPDGDDPPGGEPPYWSWVKHDEFRAVINLVKRYRRYWRGKNMPLLRDELGYATVDEAIATSLSTDTDYATYRTNLIATGDWS